MTWKVTFVTLEKQRLFTNGMLVKLIVPLVIEQALSILVGMCDGVMVSSAGAAAISGVALVDMINNVILKLFAALATGGAVITSQYLGARDDENARRSAGQLVLMAGFFGLAIMVLCLVFAHGLMKLFFGSITEDVMSAGLLYFRITALSFPFIALYNAGAAIFRSIGNSKVSMKVSFLMNLLNVGGNAVCIYGLKMGVAGVAVPTLISRAVAAALILYLTSRPVNRISLQLGSLRRVQFGMMKNILHIGIPSACENGIFELGRVLVVSMIALFGTTQTSANAVANNLDAVGIIVGQAMSLAMITVVGQCVGAGDLDQAIYYIKKLMLAVYVVQGACNLIMCAFLPQLIGLYSSLSPETVKLAETLVRIHALCGVVLWPAAFVLPNALRAANDVKFTMVVGIGSMFVWRISFSYLLCVRLGYGAVGVWIAMVIDWVCRSSFIVWRMLSGKWKQKCGLA